MASTINAVTSGGGGIAVGGDTSGVIGLQSNGTTFATGNQYGIGLGTAVPSSGIGIAFPATQSASSDANTLDDYEEGTWTPVWNGNTNPTVTYDGQEGTYTKIGRQVFAYFTLSQTAYSGGSGSLRVAGLPFTPANFASGAVGAYAFFTLDATSYGLSLRAQQGSNYLLIFEQTSANRTQTYLPVSGIGSTSYIYASIVYTV